MTDIRAIAFYLPQFHPVPENDEWWGKGFTEWRNTARARPLFHGHYQPHLPADLGYYDLRLPETREAQAQLAREHGIHGFCYYHYWFNGRRILERPLNEVLASGTPDLPFCVCWANENWTRVWDGGEKNVLLGQHYSHADDLAHIESLIPMFRDPRYIRVDGRPLFLVYRTELLPDPKKTADIWREAARKAGLGDLYLARVEHFVSDVDPASIGFDAAVEFAPDGVNTGRLLHQHGLAALLARMGLMPSTFLDNRIMEYKAVAEGMSNRPKPPFKRFHCVTPMWDNAARRKTGARILVNSTPERYQAWLRKMVERTRKELNGEEQIVFINAWNEWAEGCHLEPDLKWGRRYLEATRAALEAPPAPAAAPGPAPVKAAAPGLLHQLHWQLRNKLADLRDLARQVFWRGC